MGEDRDQSIIRRLAGDVVYLFPAKLRPPGAPTDLEARGAEEERMQPLHGVLAGRTMRVKRIEPGARLGIETRPRRRRSRLASTLPVRLAHARAARARPMRPYPEAASAPAIPLLLWYLQ